MGYYRYLISLLVLLSHCGIYFLGINQGMAAVVSFLIITGYTTELSLKRSGGEIRAIPAFYRKRIVRIFPQYWFYVILTLILVGGFGLWHETISKITIQGVFYNMLLLPLNLLKLFPEAPGVLAACLVIPAAWTMGLQFVWWFLAPWIRVLSGKNHVGKAAAAILFVVSFDIYVASLTGRLNAGYSYNHIFGMFWIFMLGVLIARGNKKLPGLLWVANLFLLMYLSYRPELQTLQNSSVSVGLLIGIPAVIAVKDFPRDLLDSFFGNVSYGVYLNHFLLKEVMIALGHDPHSFAEWGILILASTVLAALVCQAENFLMKGKTRKAKS